MVFFLWQDRIIARLQQPYSLDCIPVEAEYQVVQTQNCETFKQIHWHTCYSLLLFFINDLWNLYLTSLFSWIIYFWLYFPKSQASLLQSTWWIRFTWPFFLGPVTRVSNCFFPWGNFRAETRILDSVLLFWTKSMYTAEFHVSSFQASKV